MRYRTPSRAAHRAPAGSSLALVVRGPGLHRPRPQRRAPRPQRRAPREPQWAAQFLARGLATLIALAVTGLSGFIIFADDRRGHDAAADTVPDAAGAPSSRAVDASPLTLPEVFPDQGQVWPRAAPYPYRITMTHIDNECAIASTGALRALLREQDCSQVVRAGLTTPYGDYEVTAGLFNLAEAAGAAEVEQRLRPLVETGDGGFAAMAGGPPGADPGALPTSPVGWRAAGHYLVYCVITRPHGGLVAADDPNAQRITDDLVDGYLSGTVLGRRKSGA